MKGYRLKLNASIPIKMVRSSPVISAFKNYNSEHAVKLMVKYDVGSIVVTNNQGTLVDGIAEQDIVIHVSPLTGLPSRVEAKEAMSSPLRTRDLTFRKQLRECEFIVLGDLLL